MYCRDKLLELLCFLCSDGNTTGSNSDGPNLEWSRESKRQSILKWVDEVRACEKVMEVKVVAEERAKTIVGMDDKVEDDDMATGLIGSCKV